MKKLKASYTVEASILMFITVSVLAAFLITAFYLHDRAVLQASSCEISAVSCNMAIEKEREQAVSRLKREMTVQRLMGSRSLSGGVQTGKEETNAVWSAQYPVPGIVMKYLSKGKLPISVSWNSDRIRPAGMIRKIRGIRKLAEVSGEN